MASTKSVAGLPVGPEISLGHLKELKDVHAISAAPMFNLIYDNVPCRSKQRTVHKKTAKVVESGRHCSSKGDHKNEGHLSGNPLNKRRCAKRKRKRKTSADSGDHEIIIPCSRLRGQRRGPVDSGNSTTQYRKLDSKTFEGYLEDIWSRFSEEKRNSFVCLDSLWFSLYMQNSFKEKVLNWVKRKNIFSKKYVMVPIVMWSHWSLLILCNFGESPQSKSKTPCMLLLDSLQTMNPRRLEPGIRKFVLDIHNVEDRHENKQSIRKFPLLIPQVPQQRNGEECGCFVLKYISLFLENAPENFSLSDGYPYFMKEDWFTLEGLDNFCKRLELNLASRDSSISEK